MLGDGDAQADLDGRIVRQHGVAMKGGKVSGEEHRLATGLLASAAEILNECLPHRFDGLAIELHRSPVVDLDENVIVLQIIERERPWATAPAGASPEGLGISSVLYSRVGRGSRKR